MKILFPAQYHNTQNNNHDDNLKLTPDSCKAPFISQSVFLPHPLIHHLSSQ